MLEANKQLAINWFEQVWNQKNHAAIEQMFSADGVGYSLDGSDIAPFTRSDFKTSHQALTGAFPDIHFEVQDVLAEEDRVAVRWTANVTHLGDHLGFPATGKKGVLVGSTFMRIRDGQIVEGWNQMNFHALLARIQAP